MIACDTREPLRSATHAITMIFARSTYREESKRNLLTFAAQTILVFNYFNKRCTCFPSDISIHFNNILRNLFRWVLFKGIILSLSTCCSTATSTLSAIRGGAKFGTIFYGCSLSRTSAFRCFTVWFEKITFICIA